MPVAKGSDTPTKVLKARTPRTVVDPALMQQYAMSILKYLGASWATEGAVGLDANESMFQQICDYALAAFDDAQDALDKDGVGLQRVEINAFKKQLLLWHKGAIDFSNARQANLFSRCQDIILAEIRYVFLEYDDDILTENMKLMRQALTLDQIEMIDYFTGLQMGLNSNRYYTKKNIRTLIGKLRKLLPNLETVLVGAGMSVQPINREQEFELAPGYDDLITRMKNLLVNYPTLPKVDGYDYTLNYTGETTLKRASDSDYAEYSDLTRKLKAEALRSLHTNLASNEGAPMKFISLVSMMKSDGVYIPPNIMPSPNFTGYAVESVKNGRFDVEYLSPFKEPLDKIPRGMVVMNESYKEGSTNYVCTYVDPVSKGLSKNYVATKSADAIKRTDRYSKTLALTDNVETYRAIWLGDITKFVSAVKPYITSGGGELAEIQSRYTAKAKPPPIPNSVIRNGVLGLICELGYQVAPRTGEKDNATLVGDTKVSTYAISTVRLNHLTSAPEDFNPAYAARLGDQTGTKTLIKPGQVQKLIFEYPGKDAQKQYHLLTKTTLGGDADAKKTWEALTGYLYLLSDQLYTQMVKSLDFPLSRLLTQQVFKVPNANATTSALWVNVDNRIVLKYLAKRIGFGGQTFKAFRKLKATKVFKDFMDGVKDTLTADTIDKTIMTAAKTAGAALGHAAAKRETSGDMALRHYIVPQVVRYYYDLISAEPNAKIGSVINSVNPTDK